jgi:hypothetical protein
MAVILFERRGGTLHARFKCKVPSSLEMKNLLMVRQPHNIHEKNSTCSSRNPEMHLRADWEAEVGSVNFEQVP